MYQMDIKVNEGQKAALAFGRSERGEKQNRSQGEERRGFRITRFEKRIWFTKMQHSWSTPAPHEQVTIHTHIEQAFIILR